jgi:hypothetical protein
MGDVLIMKNKVIWLWAIRTRRWVWETIVLRGGRRWKVEILNYMGLSVTVTSDSEGIY